MKFALWRWYLVMIIIATAVDLAIQGFPLAPAPFINSLLLWGLVIGIGVAGIIAFMGHFFRADEIAEKIGWPAGNPFQREVAFANLGYGVAGICCFAIRDGFWLATIIIAGIFLIGAGTGHIFEMKNHGNVAEYNTGAVVAYDILMPVSLGLLWVGRAIVG